MSIVLDDELRDTGTRFLIFPQPRFLDSFRVPERVFVSRPVGSVQPGPEDDRMYVVDAIGKAPYAGALRPPYREHCHPKVQPGPDGHFDHLDPDSREFSAATMYATVRRVLDIWEDYFGRTIIWHFEADFEKLELIPLVDWDNAQSGYGFLEFGYAPGDRGGIDHTRPYCQNFDVLAHELGHSIIFAEVGVPAAQASLTTDYLGFHESAGDLVAIISGLHFDTVMDHLLEQTHGNLFTVNELDRVGELSDSREIRVAFNSYRMSDVGEEPHRRSLPLTGGIFDVMVEVFQRKLVEMKLISARLAEDSTQGLTGGGADTPAIRRAFRSAYCHGDRNAFKWALLQARDYVGTLLTCAWSALDPDFLTYHEILRELLRADRRVAAGAHQETIRSCFAWREISLLPQSFLLQTHTLRDCSLRP